MIDARLDELIDGALHGDMVAAGHLRTLVLVAPDHLVSRLNTRLDDALLAMYPDETAA